MTSGGTSPTDLSGFGAKAAELVQSSSVKITRETFKDAPAGMKLILYAPAISGAVFGVCLVIALVQSAWVVVVILAILLLIGLYIPNFRPPKVDVSILKLSGIESDALVEPTSSDMSSFSCRSFPIYPLADTAVEHIRPALEEVRSSAVTFFSTKNIDIPDRKIRANIFLLARISGGSADGSWKLVIDKRLAINMNHAPELGMQLSIGQGATGVAYRDGSYGLTRRLAAPPKKGEWASEFKMTPELCAQVHRDLKWIVSIPLLRPHTNEALGVLNIDGLYNIEDNDVLNEMAGVASDGIDVIAKALSLQPSTCLGHHQLGVLS